MLDVPAATTTDNLIESYKQQSLAVPSTDDYRTLADFRYYLRRFLMFSESITATAGLPPSQYQVLLAVRTLSDAGPVTSTALAAQLCLKLNSVVELIDRLVAAGLMTRTRAHDDRRNTVLALTPDGLAVLAPLAAQHLEHHRAHLPELIASMTQWADNSSPQHVAH